MTGREIRAVKCWLPLSSEVWPDEALERGFGQAFCQEKERLGVDRKGNCVDINRKLPIKAVKRIKS